MRRGSQKYRVKTSRFAQREAVLCRRTGQNPLILVSMPDRPTAISFASSYRTNTMPSSRHACIEGTFWLLLLGSVHGLVATPDDVRNVERRATTAICSVGTPCGYWSPYWAQFCCGEGQYCTTDALNVAKCAYAATSVVTITTNAVRPTTSTARTTSNSTPPTTTSSPTRTNATTSALSATQASPIPNATTSANTEPTHGLSKTATIGIGVGAGIGAAIILAGLIWCIFAACRNRRNREDEGPDNGTTRVTNIQPSPARLAEIRESAAEQARPPSYHNQGPNPFDSQEMVRSREQGFGLLDGFESGT